MIMALVERGKRIGVTAGSHKVISNLLSTLCKEAGKTNTKLSIVQKPNNGDGCEHDLVKLVDSNEEVLERLQSGESQVAAGTAWLWSREEFAGSVDVLFFVSSPQKRSTTVG